VLDHGLRAPIVLMGMDTPWMGTMRQRLARYRLRNYLSRLDGVLVPGERAYQYARRLRIGDDKIRRGLYAINFEHFKPCLARRNAQPGGWPRRFLFTGRYCDVKGVDVLVSAYKDYRSRVAEPWELVCCGSGPDKSLMAGVEGIDNRGFVQPDRITDVYDQVGAFVLASRYDPWPLVIPEACASGLPILCTNACGSAVELVRDNYNGFLVATESVSALSDALVRAHRVRDQLPIMGARSQEMAEPYSARHWPIRAFGDLLPA
jgi:glycosyltransferase involved in cell wall biosynthesis